MKIQKTPLAFGFHDYLSQESAPIRRTSTVWESSERGRNGWRCVSFFFNFCWHLISEIICWWHCDTMVFFPMFHPNSIPSRASGWVQETYPKIHRKFLVFLCSGHNFPPSEISRKAADFWRVGYGGKRCGPCRWLDAEGFCRFLWQPLQKM